MFTAKSKNSTQSWRPFEIFFVLLSNYHFCFEDIGSVCFIEFLFILFHLLTAVDCFLKMTDKQTDQFFSQFRKTNYFINVISATDNSEKRRKGEEKEEDQ